MNKRKSKFFVFIFLLFTTAAATAQTADTAGFFLRVLKNTSLSAYTQVRYQKQADNLPDGVDIRRARLDLKCATSPEWDYRLQVDFGGLSPKLLDATITYKHAQEFSVMAGQFKIPFCLDNITSSAKLDFINRSQAAEALVARTRDIIGNQNGRDIGAEIFGSIIKINDTTLISYYVAILDGQGINLSDLNVHKDIAGRLVIRPVKGLSIGGAVYSGYDRVSGYAGNTVRNRYGAELSYTWENLNVQAEYIYGRDGVTNRAGHYGYVGYYFLQRKIQLLARYDFFDSNTETDDDATVYYIGGVNFFFSGNAKLMLNYEVHSEESTEIPNNMFLAQLQISF